MPLEFTQPPAPPPSIVQGSAWLVIDTPSSPYLANNYDEVWWSTANGPGVVQLPIAPSAGTRVRALRSGANSLTVQGNGNTIVGATNDIVIDMDKYGAEFIWDPTSLTWNVIFHQHA